MSAAGKSLKEIAHELSLSPKTVSTFRTRVFEKLSLKNDVELARYVSENGMAVSEGGNPIDEGLGLQGRWPRSQRNQNPTIIPRLDWRDSSPMSITRDCLRNILARPAGRTSRSGEPRHGPLVAEQAGAKLAGPAPTTADTLEVAASYLPHVVLLDFHGLSILVARTTALLKTI